MMPCFSFCVAFMREVKSVLCEMEAEEDWQ